MAWDPMVWDSIAWDPSLFLYHWFLHHWFPYHWFPYHSLQCHMGAMKKSATGDHKKGDHDEIGHGRSHEGRGPAMKSICHRSPHEGGPRWNWQRKITGRGASTKFPFHQFEFWFTHSLGLEKIYRTLTNKLFREKRESFWLCSHKDLFLKQNQKVYTVTIVLLLPVNISEKRNEYWRHTLQRDICKERTT